MANNPGGLFANNTTTPPATGNLFGNPSQNIFAKPTQPTNPATSLVGQANPQQTVLPGGGNLFSGNAQTTTPIVSNPQNPIFPTTVQGAPSTTPATGGLFNNSQAPTTAPTTTTQTTGTNLFNNQTNTTQPQTQTTTTQPNLFSGNNPSTTVVPGTTTTPITTPATGTTSTNLFSTQSGSTTTAPVTGTNPSSNLFGNPTTSTTTAGNTIGQPTTQSTASIVAPKPFNARQQAQKRYQSMDITLNELFSKWRTTVDSYLTTMEKQYLIQQEIQREKSQLASNSDNFYFFNQQTQGFQQKLQRTLKGIQDKQLQLSNLIKSTEHQLTSKVGPLRFSPNSTGNLYHNLGRISTKMSTIQAHKGRISQQQQYLNVMFRNINQIEKQVRQMNMILDEVMMEIEY